MGPMVVYSAEAYRETKHCATRISNCLLSFFATHSRMTDSGDTPQIVAVLARTCDSCSYFTMAYILKPAWRWRL
jgi:hypothetical protein